MNPRISVGRGAGIEDQMRVSELMTTAVVTVRRETPLKDVARLLTARRITGVPVVDDTGVVGVVSQTDIVSLEEQAEDESVRPRRFGRRHRQQPAPVRVAADVMRSPAITVDPRSSAVGAAWTMTRDDVSRLPVVEDGKLVGILTRSDLIRGFARSDEAIRREILDEVVPSLGVSPNDIVVSVADGVVVLRGEVEDDGDVRCLPHAVRGVVGVVEVVPQLTARHERTLDRYSPIL